MRRLLVPLLVVALSGGLLSTAPTASAAPPTAAWTGAAQADTLAVDLDVTDGRSASARANSSQASSGSGRTPNRSTAQSSNVTATVAGLSATMLSDEADAGPDAGDDDYARGMAATSRLGVVVGALTIKGRAAWAGDDACVAPGRPLAEASTRTASVSLAPVAGSTRLATTGVSTTTGRTELVANGNGTSNYGVASLATGTIADVDVFGAHLKVTGTTTLSARATGAVGGATFEYHPGTITVQAPGGRTRTVNPGATRTVTVDRGSRSATVKVKANKPETTLSSAGTSAQASVSVLTASVVVTSSSGNRQVLNASVALLPLRASAAVPAGGIDCSAVDDTTPPNAPVVTAPQDGSRTTDRTPTISGTAEGADSVEVFVDGESIGSVAASGGTWTTDSPRLARGRHEVMAVATDAAGNDSQGSDVNSFRVVRGSDGDDGDGNDDGNDHGDGIWNSLASTGGPPLLVGLAALVLLTAGSVTLVAARRRRHQRR